MRIRKDVVDFVVVLEVVGVLGVVLDRGRGLARIPQTWGRRADVRGRDLRRGRLWDRLEFGQRWRRRRRRRGRSARIWRWRSGRRVVCARDNPVGLRRTPRARAGARGRCALLALLALRARARGAWFWRCRLIARGRIIWLRQRLWIARGRILWRILRRLFKLLFSSQMRRRVHRHIREIRSVVESEGTGRGGRRSSRGR